MRCALSRRRDQTPKPWKNSGGITTELFARPEGSSLETFDLRISRARVEQPGPFSFFPGIDRTLLVVQAGELRLRMQDHEDVTLHSESAPYSFSGDLAMHATLPQGPIEDLNVMTRRGRCTHRVERLELSTERDITPRGILLVFVVLEGTLTVEGATLEAGEAVLYDDAAPCTIKSLHARLARVDVFPLTPS